MVRVPGLKVAGRTSSFSYRGQEENIPSISKALGVAHVLEGSVRRSGNKLRITAQLIRGDDGFHLWSETYDREIAEIFEIQDEIAQSVTSELVTSLGLSSNHPIVAARTENIVAYENYLKARQLHVARGKENLDQALLLLQEAVALDPSFAPAWAETAGIYANYYAYQDARAIEQSLVQWRTIGAAAANRAIELNPTNGVAHAHLGALLAWDNDWIRAFASYARAIDLAPNDPSVADSYAQTLLESGYAQKALEFSRHAVELDPLAAVYRNALARALVYMGEFDRAEAQFKEAISLDPTLEYLHNNLLRLLYGLDRPEESIAVVKHAISSGAYPPNSLEIFETINDAWGDDAALKSLIGNFGSSIDRGIAITLQDRDLVVSLHLPLWERENSPERGFFVDFAYDIYRHPVWKEQLRRNGILDLWLARGFPAHCQDNGDDDFECDPRLLRK